MAFVPTDEQKAIIEHPLGRHARVLAVAGSGKTTTMVHRVHHLVTNLGQNPSRIRVVMFNRLAREDFQRKLNEAIPELGKRPKVLTFHALAFAMRADATKNGLLARDLDLWIADKEELALICMHRAIDSLLREGVIEDDVDPQEALDAVGLWKASLIPPERAGHRTNPDLPLVYRRFEDLREQQRGLTFDDFVPKAMDLMKEGHSSFRRRWTNRLDHLIVDEYQDINYGQQQLIRLLAGTRADVTVVGDDDQTIYEWRAARPHYILHGFAQDFDNKPIDDYQLSHSFRFGPLVAQAAYNVISFNQQREAKPLVSHDVRQATDIEILTDVSEQPTEVERQMAQEMVALVRDSKVPPSHIGVLGRTFVQLDGLQSVFIERGIPFRVLGSAPFFERDENCTLVDYVRLALDWDKPAGEMEPCFPVRVEEEGEESAQSRGIRRAWWCSQLGPWQEAVRTVLAVANTPSRLLSRDALRRAVEGGAKNGLTLGASLEQLLDERESPLPYERREALQELVDLLHRIAERVAAEPDLRAGELLGWIVRTTGYEEHFERYYGEGTASVQRIASVHSFLDFVSRTGLSTKQFIDYLATFDSTRGLPSDRVITMTSVHRTKGLEYDYVFIPNCTEGHMPVHIADDVGVYDTQKIVPDHPPSPPIENERRLFYVAVTRAIKRLCIGISVPPELGLQKQSSASLPSRFLCEMQFEPTRTLISAFQGVLRDQDGGTSASHVTELLQALTQLGDHHSLVRYVAEHYLSALADPGWAAKVDRLLSQTAEVPFTYDRDYPDVVVPGRSSSEKPPEPTLEDVWRNVGC